MDRKRKNRNAEDGKSGKQAKNGSKSVNSIVFNLNETIVSNVSRERFQHSYKQKINTSDEDGPHLFQKPFCHCVLPNFVADVEALDSLQEEVMDLTFQEKNNDLYKFHQSTEDLQVIRSPYISALRKLIYEDLRQWITDLTGIELNDNVDMSCASYQYTDILCCHDDELDDRRIAFILYLVPMSWCEADGGSLDLFSVDKNGEPDQIVKSILPVRNNFVFFEVTPLSFHQVAEVLTENKTRLSVSGWFHGPPVDRPAPYIEPPLPVNAAVYIQEEEFYSWIDPQYLEAFTQAEIRQTFEEESQIELSGFLQDTKYEELKAAIESIEQSYWTKRGPPNKRNYYKLTSTELPDIIQQFVTFLQSDAMFLVLSSLTGLKLHKLAEISDSEEEEDDGADKSEKEDKGSTAKCTCEVRRWKHGCYTLGHDTDTDIAQLALDLVFFIGGHDWSTDYGGFTSYIAKGEDEELLSVSPASNSLALVYRDVETMKFVKYLNCKVNELPAKGFVDVACVYYE